MSKVDEGGPAFPIPEQRAFDGAGLVEGNPGMSLRDYFAGQAISGICPVEQEFAERTAERAYGLADAMIAARQR